MPRDVAVQRPHARVVGVELQHQVSGLGPHARLDELCVAALRVREIDAAVPVADALGQDPEVVAVQVHRVGGAGDEELVAKDDADGGIAAEVVDVPLRVIGVGGVA